jgi:hypothetical protein
MCVKSARAGPNNAYRYLKLDCGSMPRRIQENANAAASTKARYCPSANPSRHAFVAFISGTRICNCCTAVANRRKRSRHRYVQIGSDLRHDKYDYARGFPRSLRSTAESRRAQLRRNLESHAAREPGHRKYRTSTGRSHTD